MYTIYNVCDVNKFSISNELLSWTLFTFPGFSEMEEGFLQILKDLKSASGLKKAIHLTLNVLQVM